MITQSVLDSSSNKNSKYQNARRIAEMCCWDLQPFKIVERSGFQKFVKFLNPNTTLPTDRTVATTALNDIYDVYYNKVIKCLEKSPNNLTLVTDMWSDNYKHLSYINIKIHFCENFEIKIVSLKTEIFPRPHTAYAVGEKIVNTLKEFKLENKNLCAVTDGGSNIVAALKQQNIHRYACTAHTLHLFLTKDLLSNDRFQHLNTIIKKLKQIYRCLIYSSEELQRIQNLEEQAELSKIILEAENILDNMDSGEQFSNGDENFMLTAESHCSLKNSIPTRWNSLLKMIESFTKNINIINIALLKVNQEVLIIPEMEKKIIKEFGNFLKIFENATQYLQGQNYPTISTCIFFFENIMNAIDKTEKEACFHLTIDLCNFAKENLGTRFKILKIHVIAALMDPSQKNWEVLNKYISKIPPNVNNYFHLEADVPNCVRKENILLEEINKLITSDKDQQEQPSTSHVLEPKNKKQKISSVRQKMLEAIGSSQNSTNSLENEIKKYFEKDVSETEPMDWWQQHKDIYPNIAKLANYCFGIPATSSSSEQAFSFSGHCINAKRSNLHPATVKKQLFIHDNKDIVAKELQI